MFWGRVAEGRLLYVSINSNALESRHAKVRQPTGSLVGGLSKDSCLAWRRRLRWQWKIDHAFPVCPYSAVQSRHNEGFFSVPAPVAVRPWLDVSLANAEKLHVEQASASAKEVRVPNSTWTPDGI